MAAELRRYGVPVRVVDKTHDRTDQSRALFLWSRTLELLDRSGVGGIFLDAGQKIEAVNILAGTQRIGRLDFAELDSLHPYALMLPQAQTEAILEAHLIRLGGGVERGTELAGFHDQADGVTVSLRHPDGRIETTTTPYLIGCDGGGSFVRKALGLSSTGPAQQSDWLLADVSLGGFESLPTELTSFWHEDGFLGIFPLAAGRFRVIADLRATHGEKPVTASAALVQGLIDARGPGGISVLDAGWMSSFRIHERNVAAYRQGRVFLAGDAAHLHNPVGAQGLNMGIHDAVNLAWKLALVWRKAENAELLLESYNAERHAVAEHVVTNIGRAEMVALVKTPTLQFARNLLGNIFFGLSPARRAVVETMAEVSLGYTGSPLNGPEDHALPGPGPGERMAPRADEAPIGAGDTPRFALFAEPSPSVDALIAAHPTLLEPAPRPPVSPRCIWLVRPDGYVAAEVMEPDIGLLDGYLHAYGLV
jgi:2-polyprenyl-6-methoxyphenol hydroxylase-like FAD-dependent oxidoreductase